MINYSKTENSRPFNGKNGAKILAIAKKRRFYDQGNYSKLISRQKLTNFGRKFSLKRPDF